MALRIPWDKYETAILIEACRKYNIGEITHEDAVKQVSQTLRQLAINRDIEIDDIYRNENGIRLQLQIINQLLNQKKVTLHVSKLFSEIVELYHTNQLEFNKILMEAKKMLDTKKNSNGTFFEWIDSTQPSKANKIKFSFNFISSILCKKKIINHPLLQIIDKNELLDLKKNVEQNIDIFGNKRFVIETINLYINLYTKYLLSNCIKTETESKNKKEKNLNNRFFDWVDSTQPSEATEIKSLFNIMSTLLLQHKIIKYPLIQTINIDEVINIRNKGIQSLKPVIYSEESFNRILEILDLYIKYLQLIFVDNKILEKKNSNNKFFDWIDSTQPSEARITKNWFDTMSAILFQNKVINCPLIQLTNIDEIISIRDKHIQNSLCNITHSKESYDKFTEIFNLYIEYLQSIAYVEEVTEKENITESKKEEVAESYENEIVNSVSESVVNSIEEKVKTENILEIDITYYKQLLYEKFQKGFRINSDLDIERFKMYWKEKYGSEISKDNDTIRKHIKEITFKYNNFIYLPEAILDSETQEKLISYIKDRFKKGEKAISYEVLYKNFSTEFLNTNNYINNVDMLKEYLSYINNGDYFLEKKYIIAEKNTKIEPVVEIKKYLISCGMPMKKSDIVETFPFITESQVSRILSQEEFINNQPYEYFHADIVDLADVELDSIANSIRQIIDTQGSMLISELPKVIKKYPYIEERYPYITDKGMCKLMTYKLRKKFLFKNRKIMNLFY